MGKFPYLIFHISDAANFLDLQIQIKEKGNYYGKISVAVHTL